MKLNVVIISSNNLLEKTLKQLPELSGFEFTTCEKIPDDSFSLAITYESLSENSLGNKAIKIHKPLDTNALINQLLEFLNDQDIIIDSIHFNFRKRTISNMLEVLSLTEIEANLFQGILDSPKMLASKSDLVQDVLGYSKDAETKTLENHLYKLKSKLKELNAEHILKIDSDKISINIKL